MIDLSGQIATILRRYSVRQHYRASLEQRSSRYVVFSTIGDKVEQLTEPASHRHTQQQREELIIRDILKLLELANAPPPA